MKKTNHCFKKKKKEKRKKWAVLFFAGKSAFSLFALVENPKKSHSELIVKQYYYLDFLRDRKKKVVTDQIHAACGRCYNK